MSNLSGFIFSLVRAVGLILLGYGILQVGLSLQSHDPSQRSNGMLTIAGAIVPFVNSFPKSTHLYRLMSTKFTENQSA